MDIREVTYLAVIVRILVAVLIGGIIGLERGMKNRAAGLRTYMLVCVGSCLIMLTNQYIFQVYNAGDPVRLGAQVISGIGFLGAGTIIVTRRNQIKGLTTAAGLWSAAAVGLALGIGFYEAAILGALAIFVVLTLMQRMDDKMRRQAKTFELYVELSKSISLGDFLREVKALDMEVSDVFRERDSETEVNVRAYIAVLKTKHRKNHTEVLDILHNIHGVVYLEEM